jgi:deoxyribonuclease-4
MLCVKGPASASRRSAPSAPPHRFGAHLSIAGGMHQAIAAALRLKFDVLQVFVKNQRRWRAAALDPADVERWHALRATPRFGPVVAHATYLINLASADDALYERSRRAFAEELLRCDALAIPYLVVHPGAAGQQPHGRALARVAAALDRIFAELPGLQVRPLLETTAGQGTTLGDSFAELAAIIAAVQEPARVGVCVDTCHVFAAGYDIRDARQYAAMIAEMQRTIGLERIRCWHMNDSRGPCGAHLDRHEHIGRGQIGSAGFRNVLGDRRFRGLPMIIETRKGLTESGRDWDRVNVQRLRTIATRASRGR